MPYRRRAFSRQRSSLRPIDSNKNVVDLTGTPGTTIASTTLILTKDSAANTVSNEVERGCSISSIWLSFDVCGLAASGVEQKTGCYLIKNPGSNLASIPNVFAVGTSNEKNNVIKQWSYMTMRNQDGNAVRHWEGWIKIPKGKRRCAADDVWSFAFQTDTAAGHITGQCIYKWYK